MVDGLEPFLEKNFHWGTPKAPEKFKNPYFQKMILYIIVYWFFYLRLKKAILSKKSVSENMDFETFWGPWGVPQWNFFSKNGSKPSTIPRIKKSLTFGPQKITLKLIYGRFPLGGAEKAPPVSNRVNIYYAIVETSLIFDYSKASKNSFWLHCFHDLFLS